MSASEHPVLSRFATAIETAEHDHRPRITHLLEHAVNYLEQSIEKQAKLVSLRKAADERADKAEAERDAEKAGREAAEKERDELKAEKAADEAKLKDANDALDAEIGEETGADKSAENVEGQGLPPVTTTAPSGAAVTVSATSTEHAAADGTVTTLDHVSGSATAVDASGAAVEPASAAVAEAQAAKDAVGEPIPSA